LKIVSTSTFRESLKKLTKRDDSGYKNCCLDLCNELKDQSFDTLFNRHFLIRESGDLRVIKLRIQNSEQSLSSAAGYRLIIVCNRKHDHVALLEVYPKKGKYSRIDLSKNEYKDILNTYGQEVKTDSLVLHDINENLKVTSTKKV